MNESGSEIVVDASAVLAVIKGEPMQRFESDRVARAWINAVNFSEVLAKLLDDRLTEEQAERTAGALELRVVAFDEDIARAAAWLAPATRRAGLSLGDRACLATAARLKLPAVTADRAWARLNIGPEIVLIR